MNLNNFWSTQGYFGANTGFGAASPYGTTDFSHWPSQWNAADNRFPMGRLNVQTNPNYFINSIGAGIGGQMRNQGRRRRNLFTQNQVNILRQAFEQETYVKPEHREMLAKKTGLTPQQVKIWFQNNRYKCKQKQKEDDRNCSRSRDDSDRKFHADSPGSSGNSLNLTANNSPDMQIKLEDPIHNISNGENPDLKSIMGYSSDIKDPSQQGFPGFNTMYPYPVSAFPFYPNPMSYPTAATGAPQTVYHPHFQA